MRHKKSFNHLGRKSAHRKAMFSNMASSLILHKRIKTTTAKAKALKKFIDPVLTRSKDDSTHSRRVVFSYLQDKEAVSELFREVAPKIADRPGGYTRIIRLGTRLGDNADMCLMELVDFNENLLAEKAAASKSSRRRRGGKKKPVEGAEVEGAVVDTSEEEPIDVAETEAETETGTEISEAVEEASAAEEKSETTDHKEEVVEETEAIAPAEEAAEEEPIPEVKAEEKPAEIVAPEAEVKEETAEETEDEMKEEVKEEPVAESDAETEASDENESRESDDEESKKTD